MVTGDMMIKKYYLVLIIAALLFIAGCNTDRLNSPDTPELYLVKPPDVVPNHPPVISCINCSASAACPCSTVRVKVEASDPDSDPLIFSYFVKAGSVRSEATTAYWTLPEEAGAYSMIVKVSDGEFDITKKIIVEVLDGPPVLPYDI